MPRKIGLDAIDRRILAQLMEDGRRSNAVIAKDVGLSESSVRQRVARMQRDNVMRIAALTNLQRLGLWTASAGLIVSGGAVQTVAEELAAIPQVNFVALCTGTCDLSIGLVCHSRDELFDVLVNRIRSIDHVQQADIHIHVQVVKDALVW